MIFCLVRTDPEAKKQEGISFLLIDMTSPGVEVRPIRLLDGGARGQRSFLHRRQGAGREPGRRGEQGLDLRQVPADLRAHQHRGYRPFGGRARAAEAGCGTNHDATAAPLADDPLFAARMARVEIELENMKTTNLRVLAAVAGGGAPGAESSMLKIRGTQIRQEITSLYRRAMGPYARPFIEDALEEGFDGPPVGPPGGRACSGALLTTTASCRSSAAPTRSRGTSSPR